MKKISLVIIALFAFGNLLSQNTYEKIDYYGEYKSTWAMVVSNGKYGFIDKEGKEIVPPVYDQIGYFGEYKGNWALVKLNGKYGFIDTKGKVVIKPIYDRIEYFGEKLDRYAEVEVNGQCTFIDKSGKVVKGQKNFQNKRGEVQGG